MVDEIVHKNLANVAYLLALARHDHPEKEFFGDITPSEARLIMQYAKDKGINGIEQIIQEPNPADALDFLFSLDIMKNTDLKKSFEKITQREIKQNYVLPSFKDNDRLDPEELKLIEHIMYFEGLATPNKLDNFYDAIKGFTKDRKLFLMVNGQNAAINWYLEHLQDAGFHTQALTRNKDGTFNIKDQNEKERPNMIIFAPTTYGPDERKMIIKDWFGGMDKQGSRAPRLALYVKPTDTPKTFNVDAVLHEGAKMPAVIETISDLYRIAYLGLHKNGVQK